MHGTSLLAKTVLAFLILYMFTLQKSTTYLHIGDLLPCKPDVDSARHQIVDTPLARSVTVSSKRPIFPGSDSDTQSSTSSTQCMKSLCWDSNPVVPDHEVHTTPIKPPCPNHNTAIAESHAYVKNHKSSDRDW